MWQPKGQVVTSLLQNYQTMVGCMWIDRSHRLLQTGRQPVLVSCVR